jgi:PKD domain
MATTLLVPFLISDHERDFTLVNTITTQATLGASVDLSNTATMRLVLPPGVTFTSDSGIFLTKQVNPPSITPVASPGSDQVVNAGDTVTLDGSGSTDPQQLPLTFTWSQIAGPVVTLNLSDPVHPTFVAPSVPPAGSTLSFQLIVSDSQLSSAPATVNITVKHVNHPPVASVGPDQAVAEASLVTLDASASYDPDAEPLTYVWQQLSGPTVTLSDPTQAKPTFLAPLIGPAGMTLSFQLTVSDGQASTDTTTQVHVNNVNHPPVAHAGPDQTRNAGTMVQLDGTASADPDSDPLTFT